MKARYFFIIALIALVVGGGQLVSHQKHASRMAVKILGQDVAGGDTQASRDALSSYSKSHMGTSQKLFLIGSYTRAKAEASAAINPISNGKVYAEAQKTCSGRTDSISQSKCVQVFITTHMVANPNPKLLPQPKAADYTKTYPSPGFSFDSAGISILIALASVVAGASAITQRH